jgi:hypothetical protein
MQRYYCIVFICVLQLPRIISFKWKDLVLDCVINLEVTFGNCSVCGLVETVPCVVWHIAMGHGL